MADGPLTHVGEARAYHYIGDSHTGIGLLAFETPGGARIVTRTSAIWRFVASDMIDSDGLISEPVMQALRRIGAFHSAINFPAIAGLRPVLTTYGAQKCTEQLALTQVANDAPYVFSVGEINARYILHRLVSGEVDFEVPFPTQGLEQLPAHQPRQTLGVQQILQILVEEFNPLFRGLKILRDAGLRSIFLHSLPPPAVDDADSQRVLQHPSPSRVRYKLAMFINYLFEAVCRDIGIGFINMWPLVTRGNVLDAEFYLDGLHLNRKHAILSVQEVHRQFTALRASLDLVEAAS